MFHELVGHLNGEGFECLRTGGAHCVVLSKDIQ